MNLLIKRRPSSFSYGCLLFVSYVAILQVLYAFQPLLVSVPCVAIVSTGYVLLLQRALSLSKTDEQSDQSFLSSTGSTGKTSTNQEQDLQHLLIQQTEEVLQTDLEQFRKVNRYDSVQH
jgi:hypothetical protein